MALKTKQFLRAMASRHIISDIQKFILEKHGYFEYYKNKYAKLCKFDAVVESYQITTNHVTDQIRSGEIIENHDENFIQNRINILASTDILEYFRRRNIPLVIYRFRRLADQGIETLHQLINEYCFPRDDRLKTCAREILSFFPEGWVELVTNATEVNSEITYSDSFFVNNWQLIDNRLVTVKNLRAILLNIPKNITFPFQNYDKFELLINREENHNPFLLFRKALHAPKDRSYKYRILHGDIFCNSRMYKFKMVESPYCSSCPDHIETIKHVLWDCPRAKNTWEHLNSSTRDWLGCDYVSYDTVIRGNTNPNMAMETMITWLSKLILGINRDHISLSQIENKWKTLLFYERSAFGRNSKIMKSRWVPLLAKFQ
jgi:hypothetical protein